MCWILDWSKCNVSHVVVVFVVVISVAVVAAAAVVVVAVIREWIFACKSIHSVRFTFLPVGFLALS